MDLRKINNILSLFLELSEDDKKTLLNLLTQTSDIKGSEDVGTKKTITSWEDYLIDSKSNEPSNIMELIKELERKKGNPWDDITMHPSMPYAKRSNPFHPTITY